ncbi:MAG TPA: hypothetical protein ENI80_05870 [Acidiferrobacteraceae bacterium]|nr:hypothetical protein [Acidiferrobacteraceae bacterium]
MKTITEALRTVLSQPLYSIISGISFVAFLVLYLLTLPSSYTGGQIGLVSLQFLDAKFIGLSIVMATLVALLIPLMIFLIKQGLNASKSSATGGIIIGLITPILCCSPLLPIVLGFIASALPSLGGLLGPQIQGYIATHQSELFLVAIFLLALALYQNASSVVKGIHCRTA